MPRSITGPAALSLLAVLLAAGAPPPTLSAEAPAEISAPLVSLDAKHLVLLQDGKRVSYPVQPFVSLRRFGEPGAAVDEFQPGEQVRVSVQGGAVTQVTDQITGQLERRQLYRVVSQDRQQYRFTVEPVDATTEAPQGERWTLGYGRPTLLITRESPDFVFRVFEGLRLSINYGTGPEGAGEVAREVLDVPSRERFARQQRLRTLARLDEFGAPAQVETTGPATSLRLGPDAVAWAKRLQAGDRLQVSAGTRVLPGVLAADPAEEPRTLRLQAALSGVQAGEYVTVKPVREQVSFSRDVEPILQVNCLPCHGVRGANGFTATIPERLMAGGPRGKGVVPGKSRESMLYLTMSGDQNPRMPPDRDVTREQLNLIRRWIDAGAVVERP